MLFPTSLLELTRRERTVTALFGRVHVNRFLKGNYFSGLNVINLNSPLVKLLPVITVGEVAMLTPRAAAGSPHRSLLPRAAPPPRPENTLSANPRAGAGRGDTGHGGGTLGKHGARPCR